MTQTILHSPELVTSLKAWKENTLRPGRTLRAMEALPQESVVAGAKLGTGLQRDITDGDILSQHKGSPEQLSLFKASPANGLTTILGLARRKSGFNPSDLDKAATSASFQEYSKLLHACPILNFDEDGVERETVEHSDYNALIDRVCKIIKTGMASDVEGIRDGLVELVRTAASKHQVEEEKNLFVCSFLEGNGTDKLASKKAITKICFTQVHLKKDDSKGVNVQQSSFAIANMKISLDGGLWAQFAEEFWNDTYESVSSWLNGSATPKGTKPHNLCIR
jgi:hypothetical protein